MCDSWSKVICFKMSGGEYSRGRGKVDVKVVMPYTLEVVKKMDEGKEIPTICTK